MDGLVCPNLAGFFRLTQRLKAKIQKKKDCDKELCPICGCKSHKGNLCQACFVRSFRPIAYSRNIKVVEQKEFFYGPGKDRWWRKKRVDSMRSRERNDLDEDVLKMVISAKTKQNASESSEKSEDFVESNSGDERSKDIDKPKPSPSEHQQDELQLTPYEQLRTVDIVPSSEMVRIDLVENTTTQTDDLLEPLPKFLPDFWEDPQEERSTMTSRILKFKDHVIKEAQRPFKEMFCDSTTDVISSMDSKVEERSTADTCKEVLQKEQQKCTKPLLVCCKSDELEAQGHQNHIKRKQMKQNAIVELLKVAFKTNMILNNLYQHFKKVVESDGSGSEYSETEKAQLDNRFDDCKISVDSFFFRDQRSGFHWGAPQKQHEPEADVPNEREMEVIEKSQNTLWMLKRKPELALDQVDGDFIGPIPANRNIFTVEPSSQIDRLVTRKYHSEHSKLRLTPDDGETRDDQSDDGLKGSWCSSGLGLQPVVAAGTGSYRAARGSAEELSSATGSNQSGKSLLDLVFGLNRSCIKPSLVPLPDCQQDLITLSTPRPSKDDVTAKTSKDADSQTALSAKHLEQEMNLLHQAFLDQLTHFSVQLVESCKAFGHSWQTSFLAELVDHFRTACNIISMIMGESACQSAPSSHRLDELQEISNQISISLAKLRVQPHSFFGDCADHDVSTLMSSLPDHLETESTNTWV